MIIVISLLPFLFADDVKTISLRLSLDTLLMCHNALECDSISVNDISIRFLIFIIADRSCFTPRIYLLNFRTVFLFSLDVKQVSLRLSLGTLLSGPFIRIYRSVANIVLVMTFPIPIPFITSTKMFFLFQRIRVIGDCFQYFPYSFSSGFQFVHLIYQALTHP